MFDNMSVLLVVTGFILFSGFLIAYLSHKWND
ncbi:TPA: protein MgtS [Citrobacter freundii]